jgi:2,4-didehydro-3-deoxy-L-rhamnonate hydrolase
MYPVLVNVSLAFCRPFPALLFDDRVIALEHWRSAGLLGTDSIADLLDHWDVNLELLKELCGDKAIVGLFREHGISVPAFHLHAPVAPRQVFCTIGNYRCQMLQAALDAEDGPEGPGAAARREAALSAIEVRQRDGEPYIGLKGAVCVSGPHDPLVVDGDVSKLDWESEIGVVIGRGGRNIPEGRAFEHVAGYCVVNDITARDRVFRQDVKLYGTDWVQSKSQSGWLPTGPWLVPEWNVADPSFFRPWLRLNGTLMQDGVAGDMIFGIDEQIAYLSRHTLLRPGDLICTGTPAGIGSHYGRFLKAGDVVEAGVQGLGAQRVVCRG